MSELCNKLHMLVREGKRFNFGKGYDAIPHNGICIMFEKGESAHSGDRIVYIGTHTGEGQLKNRIVQHFEKENKNRSILRKNIGRCFLNRENNPYLKIWDVDTTTKDNRERYKNRINKSIEEKVEKEISDYMQTNLSFCVLNVPSNEDRSYYKEHLIGTISSCLECQPSSNWLGMFSPKKKIRQSGLWLEIGLGSTPLSADELSFISTSLVRA